MNANSDGGVGSFGVVEISQAWDEYAPKLVKYYGRLGFKTVKEVGDNGFFEDLPHLLVWGGVGTRMDGDLQQLLSKWGGIIRKQAAAQ